MQVTNLLFATQIIPPSDNLLRKQFLSRSSSSMKFQEEISREIAKRFPTGNARFRTRAPG